MSEEEGKEVKPRLLDSDVLQHQCITMIGNLVLYLKNQRRVDLVVKTLRSLVKETKRNRVNNQLTKRDYIN